MRLDPGYLVWRALVVLATAAREDESGRSPDLPTIRFILAFLFAVGDGQRAGFTIFWDEIRSQRGTHPQSPYGRFSRLNSGVEGIVRAIGPNPTGALLAAIGAEGSYAAFRTEVRHQIDMGERKHVRPDAWT